MKYYFIIFFILLSAPALQAQELFEIPAKGFTSWQPASSWEHALLSGNGTMGAIVTGQPHDETIILSHSLLYIPRKRSESLIDQGSKLQEIRKLMLQGKYEEAAKIPVQLRKEQGYDDERDPFIPAFDVRIQQEPSNITRYQRAVNFQTGEAIVDWQDHKGRFRRKLFVSRADSIIVISIKGTSDINCTISFENRPVGWNQWSFVNEHIEFMHATAGGEWLDYHSEFKNKSHGRIHGYRGMGRVQAINGKISKSGNALVITNAKEVLLFIKILPLYDISSGEAQLKNTLQNIQSSYAQLLSRHVKIHGELFDRVKFDLAADKEERQLHSEEILLKAKQSVPLALIEKTFDAGRYNIISATGTNPPNLQGIWSGTWTAPWAGSMTNDGNLPVAVSFLLPGNTPGLMDAFFNYHERLLPDYRTSARALFKTRGIHIPAQATTSGLDTDFGETWCLTFWTGGAGWVSNYFWDHYQYTLDENFLQQRAYPFMKEALLFYEDFLKTGEDGRYIFNPSYSPENNPENSLSQATINATMDVMIAKQLLGNCIKAAGILQTDEEKIKQWQNMLAKMPAYKVNYDGVLSEWIWKDLNDRYQHRHASQLYALFDEVEDEFKNDQNLRDAASRLIEEKMKFRNSEGGGEMAFGLVQLGMAAAHLGQSATAYRLLTWLASQYWTHGMGSFHNVNSLFNTDISGGLPYLVSQLLVYSEMGMVSFFPALPSAWTSGKIDGLLLRGNTRLQKLEWNDEMIEVHLFSPVNTELEIHFPFKVQLKHAGGVQYKTDQGKMHFNLPANHKVELKFQKIKGQ